MSLLNVEGLYKTYGEKTLFDHISFHIEPKERIGLIGPNGTGKSTLLKVIAGLESFEEGDITKAGTLDIEFLEQDPEMNGDETILDYIFSGTAPMIQTMKAYEQALADLEHDPQNEAKQEALMRMQNRMDQEDAWDANLSAKTILTKLGVKDVSRSVHALSGGQKKRVAIAKNLIQPAGLLILDEPTNHLDNATIEWLEGYLSQYSGAVILVTHDRYFLNRVANRIYELNQGQLYTYKGNYEVFLEKKSGTRSRGSGERNEASKLTQTRACMAEKRGKSKNDEAESTHRQSRRADGSKRA